MFSSLQKKPHSFGMLLEKIFQMIIKKYGKGKEIPFNLVEEIL